MHNVGVELAARISEDKYAARFLILPVTLLFALLFVERRRARVELGIAGAILGLLLVQMAVGEVQWREGLPWGLVLFHVTLATVIWILVVALAVRIVLGQRARLP